MKNKIKLCTGMVKATLFFTVILASVSLNSAAQWTTNGTNIYNSNTGNVGIGTTAPASKFNVIGESRLGAASNYVKISATGSLTFNGTGYYQVANNKYVFKQLNSASRGLYINQSSSRFEFRDSSANNLFHLDYSTANAYSKSRLAIGSNSFGNGNNCLILGSNGASDGGMLQINCGTFHSFCVFLKSDGDNFNIYGDNVLGTGGLGQTPFYKIDAEGRSMFGTNTPFSTTSYLTINSLALGITGAYSSTGWLSSSDERLKMNIKPLENSLEKILKLQGVSFNWINAPNDNHQVGFIAQEVEKIFPEVIVKGTKGEYSMVPQNLLAPIVEAIKERQKQIEEKDKEIKDLEQAVANLQNANAYIASRLNSSENSLSQCCINNSPASEGEHAMLEQSNPNPSSEPTLIHCYIPLQISSATLKIYSLTGAELKSIAVVDRGLNKLEIARNTLSPGTYNYLLVADGITIDTKQIILTK